MSFPAATAAAAATAVVMFTSFYVVGSDVEIVADTGGDDAVTFGVAVAVAVPFNGC